MTASKYKLSAKTQSWSWAEEAKRDLEGVLRMPHPPNPVELVSVEARERLLGFLQYCHEVRFIDRVPKLTPIKVDEVPTPNLDRITIATLGVAGRLVNKRTHRCKDSLRFPQIVSLVSSQLLTDSLFRLDTTSTRDVQHHVSEIYIQR